MVQTEHGRNKKLIDPLNSVERDKCAISDAVEWIELTANRILGLYNEVWFVGGRVLLYEWWKPM